MDFEARKAVEAFALSEWAKMTPAQREVALANVKANAKELSRIRKNLKRRKTSVINKRKLVVRK
jgi:hypothetical protein